jgi:CRP-like cAMP-binding protein
MGQEIGMQQTRPSGRHECSPPAGCVPCLAATALAAGLSQQQLDTLFGAVEVKKLARDEILFSEGDTDDHLYAIARGNFTIVQQGASGPEVLTSMGAGCILGELAFLDDLKRTATVQAGDSESCVVGLRRSELESLLPKDPELVYKVMCAIVRSAHGIVGSIDRANSELMHYVRG